LAGYSFKLEKVLNYKEKLENIKKAEYGDINRRLNNEEEKLLNYNNYKQSLVTEKNQITKNINVGHLKLYNDYLQDISNMIENQEKVVIEIKKDLEIAKEELLIAMKEKKSFEKLKEIKYEEYLFETKKNEEKIVDGIVTFNTTTQQ